MLPFIVLWVWVHLNWVLSELSVNPTNMMHFQPWGPISVSADPSGLLVISWPLQTLGVQFETTGDWDLCLEYPARPLSSTKAELVRPITFFKASIKTLLSLTCYVPLYFSCTDLLRLLIITPLSGSLWFYLFCRLTICQNTILEQVIQKSIVPFHPQNILRAQMTWSQNVKAVPAALNYSFMKFYVLKIFQFYH